MGIQVHGYRARTGPFAAKQRRLGDRRRRRDRDRGRQRAPDRRSAGVEPPQVGVRRDHVARAAHAAQHHRRATATCSPKGVVGALSREQQDTVVRVQRAGVELLDLVNATLDMGRLEAGRDPVAHDEVDLDAVLRQLDIELGPLVGAGRRPPLAESARRRAVVTDAAKLKTILKNLVGNALKFTTSGSVDVLAHWRRRPAALRGARHRHRHPGRRACRSSSRCSARPTARRRARSAASASACTSCGASSTCSAARCRSRARSARLHLRRHVAGPQRPTARCSVAAGSLHRWVPARPWPPRSQSGIRPRSVRSPIPRRRRRGWIAFAAGSRLVQVR